MNLSSLFMAHLNLKSQYDVLNLSNRLYLGDEVDRSVEVFGMPPKAYDVTDLPEGWKDSDLRATGWETSNEAFAAILRKEKVAFAMFTVEGADDRLLGRVAGAYRAELGRPFASVSRITTKYQFWKQDGGMLMISSTRSPGSGTVVTLAMGVDPLMEALRMDPKHAEEDAARAEQKSAKGKN